MLMTGSASVHGLELYLHDHGQDEFQPVCRIDFEPVNGAGNPGYPIGLSPKELELVVLLLAANPQPVRDVLNKIAERAYDLGLEHGRVGDGIIFAGSSPGEGLPPGRFCELVQKYQASIQDVEQSPSSIEPAEPCDFGGRLTGFGFSR